MNEVSTKILFKAKKSCLFEAAFFKTTGILVKRIS